MRVMQPEVRADGQVYLKEPQSELVNPQFVVEVEDNLVAIVGDENVAVPICIPRAILSREQMEEVMIRVAMALITMDTVKPGDPI